MDQIRKAKSEGVAKSYEPSPHERAAIGAFSANGKKAPRAPRMKMSEKDGVRKIAPDHPEPAVAHILLMNALGTSDLDFLNGIVTQLGNAAKSTVNDLELNFMLAVVKGLKPTDQVEAMLAAQMAVTHTATMAFAHRLARAEHILELDCSEGALCKFARTFAAQVEALTRYRSRGERNVLIEDVRQLNGGGRAWLRPRQTIRQNQTDIIMQNELPMCRSPRCGARTRNGRPCQSPAMPNGRCRMHGGMSPGAPRGNKNALKHGRYTAEVLAQRREISALMRAIKALAS